MRRQWVTAGLAALWLALPSGGQKGEARFKSVEVKHFTRSEGIELSPEFPDFLYAEIKAELQKSKVFQQILSEGEVVDPGDESRSVILGGNLLEYKKGSVAKHSIPIIGAGLGWRSLRAQMSVQRRNDSERLLEKEMKIQSPPNWDEKVLARELAKKIVGEIKHKFKV